MQSHSINLLQSPFQLLDLIGSESEYNPVLLDTVSDVAHVHALERVQQYNSLTPLQWHPNQPLLCTYDDAAWWNTHGSLVYMFDGHSGRWNKAGTYFAYIGGQDYATRTTIIIEARNSSVQHILNDVPPIISMDFAPLRPVMTILTTAGRYDWAFLEERIRRFDPVPISLFASGAWSPQGNVFVGMMPTNPTNTADPSTMYIWNQDGHLINTINIPFPYTYPWWHPQGNSFVTYHGDRTRWWSDTGALFDEQSHPRSPVGSEQPIAWTADGTHLAVIANQDIYIYTEERRLKHIIASPSGLDVASIVWHPGSEFLVAGYWDSSIRVWNTKGVLHHTIPTWHRNSSYATPFFLKWNSKGSVLAASLRDCTVHLYAISKYTVK